MQLSYLVINYQCVDTSYLHGILTHSKHTFTDVAQNYVARCVVMYVKTYYASLGAVILNFKQLWMLTSIRKAPQFK